jgi:hypothetical protein
MEAAKRKFPGKCLEEVLKDPKLLPEKLSKQVTDLYETLKKQGCDIVHEEHFIIATWPRGDRHIFCVDMENEELKHIPETIVI